MSKTVTSEKACFMQCGISAGEFQPTDLGIRGFSYDRVFELEHSVELTSCGVPAPEVQVWQIPFTGNL